MFAGSALTVPGPNLLAQAVSASRIAKIRRGVFDVVINVGGENRLH